MYLTSCRKTLQKLTKFANLPKIPLADIEDVSQRRAKRKSHIPVDDQNYITDEGGGHFMLWTCQADASIPVAQINKGTMRQIVRRTTQGRTLLTQLFHHHSRRLLKQGYEHLLKPLQASPSPVEKRSRLRCCVA